MRNLTALKTVGAGAAAALGLVLATATPAAAQSYGGDPLVGAILRGVLAASGADDNRYGYDQGSYRGENCQYYRDGRCYRNIGHWEREHGINSRDRDHRYGQNSYIDGRTYSGRGYYRDGRFWRNHGEWRSQQNHRDRDYRYDRRW